MRYLTALLLGTILTAALPASVRAQGQECELLPGAREATRSISGGEELVYISGPARFVCPDGVVLEADSAVGSATRGEVELIGRVLFQDSVKTLKADWALYQRELARLVARQGVELTDRKSHSVILGEELEYLPANEQRAESETVIQGRPHATFYLQRDETRPEGDSIPPLEVDADIMRIHGETRFVALGQVKLERGEVRGRAHEGEFDQAGNFILLTGAATLEGENYRLASDRIEATLAGDELREVIAQRDAALEAEDMDLRAPELRIYFVAGEVNRLIAVRGEFATPEPGETTSPGQPTIVSSELLLTADSIDAIMPAQELELLIAIGNAYAVRSQDSLDAGLPETIAHDWIVGDTITGYFIPAPKSEPGSGDDIVAAGDEQETEPKVVLDRLIAVGEGGRARALYRIREKGREAELPGVNYLVADRIVLVMADGEVRDVEADGPIEGIHVQPADARSGEPAPATQDLVTDPAGNPASRPK